MVRPNGRKVNADDCVYCVHYRTQERYISGIDTIPWLQKLLVATGEAQAISKLEHRPRIIIHRRENHAVA